jgi:hypothetical protein
MNELTAAIEALDPNVVAGLALATTGVIVGSIITALVRYLLISIGYSKMHRKAGEAGWKAFIPFYREYINYSISWKSKLFFLYLVLGGLTSFLSTFGYTEGAMAIVALVVGIGSIYLMVKQNVRMAKSFGKGVGTGIALMLFPGITSMILGLGKAEFTGIEA